MLEADHIEEPAVPERARVSVVIPTYQRAEALERAVRSVLVQTWPVHEVIVCDDGSTDDSRERIEALHDERVRWSAGERAGRPAAPRNRGISLTTGEWIAFLDDDDEWLPKKVEAQLKRCAAEQTQACCTNAERVVPGQGKGSSYFQDLKGPLRLAELLPVNRVICSSVLVKREVLQRTGGFPETVALRALEDYALWLRVAAFTPFSYCPEPLLRYTDAPDSSLRGKSVNIDVQRDAVLSDLRAWDGFDSFGPAEKRAIAKNLRGARRGAGRSITDWLFIR